MSQTLWNHSGLLFLANDSVVTNPASIPAAATVPRKIPPVKSFGGRAWRVGRGKNKQTKKTLTLKRWTQVSFRYYLKITFEFRETMAKQLLAKVNDSGWETCVTTRPLVPEAMLR